jgi:hypothetical protein
MNPSQEVEFANSASFNRGNMRLLKKNKNQAILEEEIKSFGEVDVIKSFPEMRGRPPNPNIDENERNTKYPETKRRYRSKNRDVLNKNKREYDKRHRERYDRYQLVINVIKELINQKKLTVPPELLQLILIE